MPLPFAPRNKASTEHRGAVEKVVFSDPAQPFVILALTDGATVCGPADADTFTRGTIYRFLGRWEDNERRGPRFRFSTHVVHAAHGRAGVVKYLTEACDGIGAKTAERIYKVFGGASVETLRSDPAKVANECGLEIGLCEIAAIQLASNARFEDTRIDLFTLFAGRGFQGKLIEQAIDKWGVKAPATIKRNPFALLGMPSAGFKRCDRLWSDLALPKHALKRSGLCAWNLLRNESQGHTWVAAGELAEKLREAVPGCDVKKALRFALRARKLKKHVDAAGGVWLAVYHRGTSEERVAAALKRLMSAPRLWPTGRVPVSQADGDRLPSQHQVDRLARATSGPVGLLLGGPGTGKSHCAAFMLREVVAEFGRSSITLAAPTGKAAVRMTQALSLAGLDLAAKTIHSTLEIGRNGHDGDGWGFVRGPGNPLDCRFLVLDEVSMCDTTLLADVLDACATGTQVLLVGDPGQLPPVGHGAPLRDLIAAGMPHGELTQVRRNAGQIVHACARIRNGESFEVADRIDLEPADGTPPKNLKLVEARSEREQVEKLVETLKSFTLFNPVWQTQVIVARNTKGDVCRKKLNDLLHPMLNPDGYAVKDNAFKVGDKIICTRNSRMHRVEPVGQFHEAYAAEMAREAGNYEAMRDEGGQPEEVYVANGEIGRVVAVAPKLTVARFSEGDALVKIPMGRQREEDEGEGAGGEDDGGGRGCNFDLAYAITVHRSQGSEWPCIIVMADPNAGMIADRNWWYTAISRASKLCVLIGQMGTIDKQRLRQQLVRRKTFLRERVFADLVAEL